MSTSVVQKSAATIFGCEAPANWLSTSMEVMDNGKIFIFGWTCPLIHWTHSGVIMHNNNINIHMEKI